MPADTTDYLLFENNCLEPNSETAVNDWLDNRTVPGSAENGGTGLEAQYPSDNTCLDVFIEFDTIFTGGFE